ncbi:MAG: hypothetical protein DRR16_24310 [Candidatus Parabeggiatoa sp. nov. 3]|nr:MAG: hypothetical protein DRR00_31555 [Gammaproteobacteria bacterium]RKZ58729.1 MAG: hypothetical protein DRQ99_24955 [Gammaproteobacteria bacterium]RKZ80185.1 MAG: hypothetical protein DRR16_24310 [Gammaproteobacteria bacterium]HEW98318.1 hypothetical protein [Beggiatoa sp.]
MYLVLLETSGNQAYLFATNRLRENVGASELTYRASTQFVLKAVQEQKGPQNLWSDDPKKLRANISQIKTNPLITEIEVIVATSGKALLLVKDREVAEHIVSSVTKQALKEAPGLDICGVISEPFDWKKDSIHEQIKNVHQQFEQVRSTRPHPRARFPSSPITALCQSSGLPAGQLDNDGVAVSAVSQVKLKAANHWRDRIGHILKGSGYDVVKTIPELEKDFGTLNWFAVVHADGNGLGKIFLNFDRYIDYQGPEQNSHYVNQYRSFSLALEQVTENAFCYALNVLAKLKGGHSKNKTLPIVPLVLGGDDLTVICDGEYALEFTRIFLKAFEQFTEKSDSYNGIMPKIAEKAFHARRLSACAGIAITKAHFPFHNSYRLAEELMTSAKTVKKQFYIDTPQKERVPYPCSAMDFHLVYDASFSHLSEIRRHLKVDQNLGEGNQTQLIAKPYVVTADANLRHALNFNDKAGNGRVVGFNWVYQHRIIGLFARIQALLKKDEEGRRQLPNNQVHSLRDGLFLGRDVANGRFKLMRERYHTFNNFVEKADDQIKVEGLFRYIKPERKEEGYWETRFLDALEVAELWKEYYREE